MVVDKFRKRPENYEAYSWGCVHPITGSPIVVPLERKQYHNGQIGFRMGIVVPIKLSVVPNFILSMKKKAWFHSLVCGSKFKINLPNEDCGGEALCKEDYNHFLFFEFLIRTTTNQDTGKKWLYYTIPVHQPTKKERLLFRLESGCRSFLKIFIYVKKQTLIITAICCYT